MGAQVNCYMNVFTVLSSRAIQKTGSCVREAMFVIEHAAVVATSVTALI